MTHEEYKEAIEYWQKKDAIGKKLSREALLAAMEEYIQSNNTCALATGSGTFVRCTPIEYFYHDSSFWMFSEGGLKFFALERNENVCLAIYDPYDGFGKLDGMQVTGMAEIVEPFCNEYLKAATFKKIPLQALKKLPSPMHLIKMTPKHIDFLHSAFREQGFNARQALDF
jgi:Pyridoxamine 5''-phosphate oxidase.